MKRKILGISTIDPNVWIFVKMLGFDNEIKDVLTFRSGVSDGRSAAIAYHLNLVVGQCCFAEDRREKSARTAESRT